MNKHISKKIQDLPTSSILRWWNSLHVKQADEAYPLGPPEPAESYLNILKIIKVLLKDVGLRRYILATVCARANPGFPAA